MAKGANVDKLAAEFADELDALGVRVAALEKKSDNVKITGQVRYRYYHNNKRDGGLKRTRHDLRSRIWFAGQVNKNWKYTGMLQNVQEFANYNATEKENVGEEGTNFQRAWVDGRIGGVKVTMGRFQNKLGDGVVYDSRMDGIKAAYAFGKVNAYGYYGKPSAQASPNAALTNLTTPYDRMAGIGLAAKFGKVGVDAGYDVFCHNVDPNWGAPATGKEVDDNKIWNIGVQAEIAKQLTLGARYLHASEKWNDGDKKDGFVIDLGYAGAKAAKPGSWGLSARYMKVGGAIPMAYVDDNSPATVGSSYAPSKFDGREGWKGYEVKATYAFAKNIVGTVAYYDWKGLVSDKKSKVFGGHLTFTF
jgi:hypothetical protein